MSVFIDKAENALGRMKLCHMLADSLDELMVMADRIGVDRKWYQGFDKASCPHFDIAKSKRASAVQNGAIEVDRRQLAAIIGRIKSRAIVAIQSGQPHGWDAAEAITSRGRSG